MRNNPRDWRIEDLLTVAKRYKIKVRTGGSSHVHFYHEDMIEHMRTGAQTRQARLRREFPEIP